MSHAEKLFRNCLYDSARSKILRHEFLIKRKLFDKLLRSTERKYNRQKAYEIEQINTKNPTELWKHISSLGPKKYTTIPLKVYDASGTVIDDEQQVLEAWKTDFSGLYNIPEGTTIEFDTDFYNDITNKMSDIKQYEVFNEDANIQFYNQEFNTNELDIVCRNIKIGKSVGPDMVPNEVLRREGIRNLLLPFINKCFIHNVIPTCWRKAIIVPIPKSASKDPYVPLNYLGISLLSCMYKLFTSLINARITAHCESNHLLADEQNGFRSGRSCLDHIYSLTSIIRNRKATGLNTFCAFVDFQKAFDWVNRELLLYKISQLFGIHGRLFNILSTIYSSSNAQIRVNGLHTETFSVSSGVRQGDIVSPILFSMYLNDLASGIKELNCGVNVGGLNVSILLYADDIVLMAEDEHSLQTMLNYIADWCSKWRMSINADKTQIVHFRQWSKPQSSFTFRFKSQILKTVRYYKYLGITLDEHVDFDLNSSILADVAGRALGAIRSKLKNLKECGYGAFNTLFNAGVLTICDYAAGVLGTKLYTKTEQVQYKAARYFLGVHRFAPLEALLGDMGWSTAKTRHKILILQYWNRLCLLPDDRITKYIFLWDLQNFHNKRGTWSYNVKHILQDIGVSELFQNISPCDVEYAKSVLTNADNDDWDIKRYRSDKLRYYNLYKVEKAKADYLTLNITKYQRSLYSQFRCGILPLEIEVGRYRNQELSQRICKLCDSHLVEDEVHFLIDCPMYSLERETLFAEKNMTNIEFSRLDSLDKFVYFMSNHEKAVITFIANAFRKRQDNISYLPTTES